MDNQNLLVKELGSELRYSIKRYYNMFFLDYMLLLFVLLLSASSLNQKDNLVVAAIFLIGFALVRLSLLSEAKTLISEGDLDSIRKKIIKCNVDRKERYRNFIISNIFWLAIFNVARIAIENGFLVSVMYFVCVIAAGIFLQRFVNKRLEDLTEEEKKYIEEINN